jgi:hypothetical protein
MTCARVHLSTYGNIVTLCLARLPLFFFIQFFHFSVASGACSSASPTTSGKAASESSMDSDLSQCHTPSFFVSHFFVAPQLYFAHRRSSGSGLPFRHHRKATTIFRSWVYLSCGRGLPSFFVHGRRDSFKLTSVQVHRDRRRPSRVGKSELLKLR